MKAMFRSFALIGLFALAGCDANPDGPSVGAGKNESGESNIRAEGEKAPATGKRGGGAEAPAPASPE